MLKTNKQSRHFISLLSEMTVMDIKARYKHAFFGFFWVILTPLLQMFIIATLFSFIIKSPVKDYYLFLFSGLLFWNFFSMSLTKASSSILDQRALIQKAKFPRLVVPVSAVFANFFHFFISILILAVWALFFGKISMSGLLLIPVGLFWALLLTLGCSVLVSAYNVRFRDISYFLQIILQVLFYATPILYPIKFIPSGLHVLYKLNPLSGLTVIIQSIFVGPENLETSLIIPNIFITLVILIFGFLSFQKLSDTFDDWV